MLTHKKLVLCLSCLAFAGKSISAADASQEPVQRETGTLRIHVADEQTDPLPCRVHLTNDAGISVRAPKLPFWRDHFVCAGDVSLSVAPGSYTLEIERGPEYKSYRGTITVAKSETVFVQAMLQRIADLAAQGWYSGELHVHRRVEDIPLLMRAEDVYVAPVITWWNNRNLWANQELPQSPLTRLAENRFYHVLAGEDEREGGALLYFGLRATVYRSVAPTREYPSPMKFVAQARQHDGVWIDIEKPFWWGRACLACQRQGGFDRLGQQPHVSR